MRLQGFCPLQQRGLTIKTITSLDSLKVSNKRLWRCRLFEQTY